MSVPEGFHPIPSWVIGCLTGPTEFSPGGPHVFSRKQPHVQHEDDVDHEDLIDLLLDAYEPTRRQLIRRVIQSGVMSRGDAEDLLAYVIRLERVAGPHQLAPAPARAPAANSGWGIDYP